MRDTIDMAREAGGCEYGNANPDIESTFILKDDQIKAFEALVRADERNRIWTQDHWTEYERILVQTEREACAKVAEGLWQIDGQFTADEFAAAIRARGNT